MERRVEGRLIAVLLICLLLIGSSYGNTVVVKGGGSEGTGTGPSPVIDAKPPSLPSPLDPSQYQHPNNPTFPSQGTTNSSSQNNFASGNISSPLIFSMTSRVTGSSILNPSRGAGFSEWRYLKAVGGSDAKETSSALNGNLDESRGIYFEENQDNTSTSSSSTAVLLLRDTTNFLGTSYNDRAIYSNKGDVVRNSFSSGAISKNSTYLGGFNDYATSDENGVSYSNKTTNYLLNSRNVGITNLDLISGSGNDSSAISEQFSGEIALTIRFKSDSTAVYRCEIGEWLPCCYMEGLDRQDYNAANIFDCTCSQPPVP